MIEVVPSSRHAWRGAEFVARTLRAAVAARGRATVAFSGGSTADPLLRELATLAVPWQAVAVLQVDERVAPAGHEDRNFTALRRRLADEGSLPPSTLHPMPVEADDLEAAAASYSATVKALAGRPPTLDLVHLGLGEDGHTASLIPGVDWRDHSGPVATTPPYEGRRRMTLTPDVLSRARQLLWFVAGRSKAPIVRRFVDGDPTIPAAGVETDRSLLLLDRPAGAALER